MNQRSCKILGILNVTPDSFSDGGEYLLTGKAVERAFLMENEGADIIDIGAESTRPGAKILSPDEEWSRLKPVLEKLKKENFKLPISLDSRNFETIRRATDYGISYVNDVSGLTNEGTIFLVSKYGLNAIFMHSLTVPADRNITIPKNEDVIETLIKWREGKLSELEKYGVDKDRLIFDPGLGFGKTPRQSVEIIKRVNELKSDIPILIGHSEKSFLKLFTDKPAGLRSEETNMVTGFLVKAEVDYIRVHNVSAARKIIEGHNV